MLFTRFLGQTIGVISVLFFQTYPTTSSTNFLLTNQISDSFRWPLWSCSGETPGCI